MKDPYLKEGSHSKSGLVKEDTKFIVDLFTNKGTTGKFLVSRNLKASASTHI
jgi:hypothetical protein